ncbi:FeoA family protein [Qipengyuania sp. DSG2-2]|uniref:FeoA family protein n=1 Tax=Qipengyuania sp. DGS2-2 TaxID=3349631 RepID=UPI0036D3EF82
MNLATLKTGQSATITGIDWSAVAPGDAKRLRALGLDTGAEVAVAYRGVFGGADPLAIQIGRTTVALRRVHAAAMAVELPAPNA